MPLDVHELNLVRRTLDNDHDAFGVLVLIYERPLSAYIYSILRDKECTRDVLQETFTAAYYALPRWTPPELNAGKSSPTMLEDERSYVEIHPLAPWLYHIATNKALNFLKQQARLKCTPLYLTESVLPGDNNPEEYYLIKELLQDVLSSLSEEDALCIVLHFMFKEKYREIAFKLNISPDAVRKRINRALVLLRSAYAAIKEQEVVI